MSYDLLFLHTPPELNYAELGEKLHDAGFDGATSAVSRPSESFSLGEIVQQLVAQSPLKVASEGGLFKSIEPTEP